MADLTSDETQEVIIRDSTTSDNELKVNPDGSINTVGTVSISSALVTSTVQITYNPPTVGNQATPLVSATPAKKIRVYSYDVSLGIASSNTYLRDGTAGGQLSVLWLRNTGGNIPSFYTQSAASGIFLFETTAGNALIANCAVASGPVSIQVVYSLV